MLGVWQTMLFDKKSIFYEDKKGSSSSRVVLTRFSVSCGEVREVKWSGSGAGKRNARQSAAVVNAVYSNVEDGLFCCLDLKTAAVEVF